MFRNAPLAATERGRRLFVAPSGFEKLAAYALHGYNVLVLAERGGGKTSSLRQLQLILRDKAHAEDPVAAFVDMSTAANVDQALERMIYEGQAATGSAAGGAIQKPWRGRPYEAPTEEPLAALASLGRCVFLLDNADPARVGYPLFGVLRDRLWDLPHQYVVAADQGDRSALLRPPADAFWEQVVELGLTQGQAAELIRRRAEDGAPWAEPLVAAIGPHPRRLIGAAQQIEAGLREPLELTAEYLRRQERLEEQSAMGQRLFHELEDVGPVSASDERLLRRIGASRPAIDRGLRELELAHLARSYFRADGPGRPKRVYELTGPGGEA
jgi:hypothetical protein